MSKYHSFSQFFPFYLSEHGNRICRRFHFVGLTLALVCLLMLMVTGNWVFVAVGLLCGYGFAWVGHFFFERNKPATFRYPLYSFIGDWKMYWQMIRGRISF